MFKIVIVSPALDMLKMFLTVTVRILDIFQISYLEELFSVLNLPLIHVHISMLIMIIPL